MFLVINEFVFQQICVNLVSTCLFWVTPKVNKAIYKITPRGIKSQFPTRPPISRNHRHLSQSQTCKRWLAMFGNAGQQYSKRCLIAYFPCRMDPLVLLHFKNQLSIFSNHMFKTVIHVFGETTWNLIVVKTVVDSRSVCESATSHFLQGEKSSSIAYMSALALSSLVLVSSHLCVIVPQSGEVFTQSRGCHAQHHAPPRPRAYTRHLHLSIRPLFCRNGDFYMT